VNPRVCLHSHTVVASEGCRPIAVHVDGLTGLVLSLVILLEADLSVHVQAVEGGPGLDERPGRSRHRERERAVRPTPEDTHRPVGTAHGSSPVKEVSVVGHEDVRLGFLNVIKPSLNERRLQRSQGATRYDTEATGASHSDTEQTFRDTLVFTP